MLYVLRHYIILYANNKKKILPIKLRNSIDY